MTKLFIVIISKGFGVYLNKEWNWTKKGRNGPEAWPATNLLLLPRHRSRGEITQREEIPTMGYVLVHLTDSRNGATDWRPCLPVQTASGHVTASNIDTGKQSRLFSQKR